MENLADINDQVVGDPMVVPLPFQCQETFFKDPYDIDDEGWGIEIFDNPDQTLKNELGGDYEFCSCVGEETKGKEGKGQDATSNISNTKNWRQL